MELLKPSSRAEELVRLYFDVLPIRRKSDRLKVAKDCAKIFITEKIRDYSKKLCGKKTPINYLEQVKKEIDHIN